MHKMFFYGTLMSPRVFEEVTGNILKATKAYLPGYQIYSLIDRYYPAIIPEANGEVQGLLVSVNDYVLDKLDWYEGSEYERQEVEVVNLDGMQLDAFTYILKKSEYDILDTEGWDFDQFKKDSFEKF